MLLLLYYYYYYSIILLLLLLLHYIIEIHLGIWLDVYPSCQKTKKSVTPNSYMGHPHSSTSIAITKWVPQTLAQLLNWVLKPIGDEFASWASFWLYVRRKHVYDII